MSPVAVLVAMSCTHVGRSDPLSGKEVRRRVQEAQSILDDFVPGAPVYRHHDEDYGWVVPLDEAALRAVCGRLGADPMDIGEDIDVPSSIRIAMFRHNLKDSIKALLCEGISEDEVQQALNEVLVESVQEG